MRKKLRTRFFGLGLLAVIAGIAVLVVAMFNQAFVPGVYVTLRTDRAGLLMAPQNDVKFHGVVVGRVDSVSLTGQSVEIGLKLAPDQIHLIPGNAVAQISPSTAFGNKFIDLMPPASGGTGVVKAGAVLQTDHVGTEVNTVFANLENVLNTARPSVVNTMLTATATAVRGQGDQLGQFLDSVNTYLRQFNPDLPQLETDLAKTGQVANLYADISPQFFHLLDNANQIGSTLVQKQQALDAFLKEIAKLGGDGAQLVGANGNSLLQTLQLLEPTSSLLHEYSPEFTCFLQGEDYAGKLLEQGPLGGGPGGGARIITNILPGKEPYTYPQNLPQVDVKAAPDCHGLPYLDNSPVPAPYLPIPGAGLEQPGADNGDALNIGSNPVGLYLGGSR